MPLEDKRKEMFSDLGRPTKRGVKPCPKCGTLNGTRGNSCKNKSCDVVFRDNNGGKKKPTTDACRIIVNNSAAEIYSVRLRDRGPDYRNFVQLTSSPPTLTAPNGSDAALSHGTFPKCFVSACNRNRVYPCAHIKAAQKCFTTSQRVLIKHSLVDSLQIPQECKQVLSTFITEFPDLYIQRCSKTSFVVKCNPSTRHPLGYLHVLFFKRSKEDGTTEPKFLCACRPFKIPSIEADTPQNSDTPAHDSPNKICIHFYSCLLAFASNEDLATEFDYFMSTAASQGHPHLAAAAAVGNEGEGEPMDANTTDAIMRDNISLLDEPTLTALNNVHGDGEFPDHIILTSSENGIIFAGSTVIEGIGEVDSRRLTQITEMLDHPTRGQQMVCQIFSSQLPESLIATGPDLGAGETTVHILTDAVLTNAADGSIVEDSVLVNSNSVVDIAVSESSTVSCIASSSDPALVASVANSNIDSQTRTTSVYSMIPLPAQSLPQKKTDQSALEKQHLLASFERWLASVNERINATMNYRLPGRPEALVYYACHEYFEILKERITSGYKKKRLPNQMRVVSYRERAPIGNFMKYVWKITNMVHVLQIFHSELVPLKMNQFFVQNSGGNYSEWVPSNDVKEDDGTKTKTIFPVLHGTSLKVGKTDATARENVPFSIEWIPDILPQSKYGELTLSFQFSHMGPIHTDEERRNSVAPLQKLIQSQTLPS